MADDDASKFYEELIEASQSRLEAFIFSLLGSSDDSHDILQETNRVLWRKRDHFEEGTNFFAWASKIAFFQVMAHRKRVARDRLVFGTDLLHTMADEMPDSPLFSQESEHLSACVSELPERQREAINRFYFEEKKSEDVATDLGIKANAVSQLLFRARGEYCQVHPKTNQTLSVTLNDEFRQSIQPKS